MPARCRYVLVVFMSACPAFVISATGLAPASAEIADAVEREQRARTNIERMARLAQALVDARDRDGNGVPDDRTQRAWDALVREAVRQDHERAKDADPA